MAGASTSAGTSPPIERQMTADRIPHVIAGAAILLVVGLLLMLMGDRLPAGFSVAVLGVFAVFGIFLVLGLLFDVIRLSRRSSGETVAAAMLADTRDGVLVTDPRGAIVYANARYAELIGADGVPTIDAPDLVLGADENGSSALARLRVAADAGESLGEELRVDGADGPRYLHVETQPIVLRGGERHTAWVITDTTADQQEHETSFVAARDAIGYLDHAPVGFFAARSDGVIAHLNATLARWLDIDLTAFRRRELRLDDLIVGDGRYLLETAPADARGVRSVELELLTRDGRALPIRLCVSETEGAGRRMLGVAIDRRALPAEAGVAEAASGAGGRFARFFNTTPVAIASVDATGRVLDPNASFIRMFDGRVARGDDLGAVVPDIARNALSHALGMAESGRVEIKPIDIVLEGDTPGKERYIRLIVTPIGEETDAHEVALVQAIESTEQKAIEAAYVQGQKMQAIGQLAGGIAHDFNNVLTSITMSADLLLDTHGAGDPSNADIRLIKTDAERAATLVRQLLAFSRKQTMQPKTLMLADTLADSRMLLSKLAKNARLDMEFGPDLWPVRADQGQLGHVMSNLVVNASDAMQKGGSITIGVRNVPAAEAASMPYRGLPNADYVMIEVIDTGTGMSPEVAEKIFEPFFTTKEVGKGTGLGLAMVYGIVKQSSGYIYADSEPGRGTRFRILLPRHVPSQVEVVQAEAMAESSSGPAPDLTGTGTILVVEDETGVRSNAVRALRSRGYTVHEAEDGEEALEVLEDVHDEVDLIVSDVVMPIMGGPELLREVRALYGDEIRFMFASGHAEDEFAKNVPVDAEFAFLPKPYSLKELAEAVKGELTAVSPTTH